MLQKLPVQRAECLVCCRRADRYDLCFLAVRFQVVQPGINDIRCNTGSVIQRGDKLLQHLKVLVYYGRGYRLNFLNDIGWLPSHISPTDLLRSILTRHRMATFTHQPDRPSMFHLDSIAIVCVFVVPVTLLPSHSPLLLLVSDARLVGDRQKISIHYPLLYRVAFYVFVQVRL